MRRMRSSCSAVTGLTTLPGTPTTSDRGGTAIRSGTTHPAAMMHSGPMSLPERTVAPMPIRQPAPIRRPCRIAPCPATTPTSMSFGTPKSVWTMTPSWRLTRGPSVIRARPTRSRAYQRHVRVEELELTTLPDVATWREQAAASARRALRAGDFLLWLGGNHLSALPVYEELAGLGDALVVQFDAHLDLYNLSGVTETLSHGNFLRHAERLPEIVNVGHRDLFLPAKAIREYYIETFAAPELATDPEPA